MGIAFKNAVICDLDPPRVDVTTLHVDRGIIIARDAAVASQAGEEVIDCGGAVVLPGRVNGHTHLYSALATGMPAPAKTPRNFHEILKYVWWRLDQALDAEAIEMSARIGALEAIRCGTTTLIDHHASPNCTAESLDLIEKALGEVGPRGVLCYETTDRNGHGGAQAGLAENRRFLRKCAARSDGQFAGLVGAHASFTLNHTTLDELAALAAESGTGVHIHVAEDPCDEEDCRSRGCGALIDRLAAHALLAPTSVFAHCTHLDARAISRVNDVGVTVAHNPRSNMNNAVGYAPVKQFRCPVMLGTDGIGADLFAEARSAWLISRHERAGLSPVDVVGMLAASAQRASASLGVTVGRLEAGAAADLVVTDYVPSTPIDAANLPGHLLFGLSAHHVRHVMIGGRWVVRDGRVLTCDEAAVRAEASDVARRLWERIQRIECV